VLERLVSGASRVVITDGTVDVSLLRLRLADLLR
jgi:hypothetical protein